MATKIILQHTIINNSKAYNIILLHQKKNHYVFGKKLGIINYKLGYVLLNKKNLLNYISCGAIVTQKVFKILENINLFQDYKAMRKRKTYEERFTSIHK